MIRSISIFAILMIAASGQGVPSLVQTIDRKVSKLTDNVDSMFNYVVAIGAANAAALMPSARRENASCFCLASDAYGNPYCVSFTSAGLVLNTSVDARRASIYWEMVDSQEDHLLPSYARGNDLAFYSTSDYPAKWVLGYTTMPGEKRTRNCQPTTWSALSPIPLDVPVTYGRGPDGLHLRFVHDGTGSPVLRVAIGGMTASSLSKFPALCTGPTIMSVWNTYNFSNTTDGYAAQRAYWGTTYPTMLDAALGQMCCGGAFSWTNGTELININACIGGMSNSDCRCPTAITRPAAVASALITSVSPLCANYFKSLPPNNTFTDALDSIVCHGGRLSVQPFAGRFTCVGGASGQNSTCGL